MFGKISLFLTEVRQEMKKVTWPTRQETIRFTALVIGISLGVAAILGVFDYVFSRLLGFII